MSESDCHDVPVEELPGPSETQLFSAAYNKDGQLQIVEVTPFDKGDRVEGTDMPVLEAEGDTTKYVQVVNSDKSMMQLDLLNLTLVRCDDGGESYRLVSNGEAGDSSTEATVTCVLHSSDNEEAENSEAYVKVDWEQGPLVFLQSDPPPDAQAQEAQAQAQVQLQAQAQAQAQVQTQAQPKESKQPPKISPTEILEKAKALQKAKQQILQSQPTAVTKGRRGRKRKSDLPPPHELLSSPNFKLFLYSCKLCAFKCNAIKEMTQHKAVEHSGGAGGKWRRGAPTALQCAVCPYRGSAHSQLMKHIQEQHTDRFKVSLDTDEVAAADVLVCGACGYESSSRALFRAHIQCVHGVNAC